jgi:molybdate transport system substrate-binding protein
MSRSNLMTWLAIGSLAVLVVLVGLLYLEARSSNHSGSTPAIKIYCAAALRPVMERIAADYTLETDIPVECEFGDSGKMLGQVTIRNDGDLFLPADDSYVQLAAKEGLVARRVPLCRMQAVVLTRPGNPFHIATLDDLLQPGLRLGIANPDRAAIGKVVRDCLTHRGKWGTIANRIDVQHANVTDAANAVLLDSRDATFVWDAVAVNYPALAAIKLPELDGAIGHVDVALLAHSANRERAERFVGYLTSSTKGLARFREASFTEVAPGVGSEGESR